MAQVNGYNATDGQTMDDRDALPAGEYPAALVKSEHKETKAKNGNAYIDCEFEVTDGEFKGRRFWTMLNLWNNNSQAVEIAQKELNSICHACGKLQINDTEELHGIPMMVTLSVKTDDYGPKNVVRNYKPLNAGAVAHQQSSQSGAQGKPWQ